MHCTRLAALVAAAPLGVALLFGLGAATASAHPQTVDADVNTSSGKISADVKTDVLGRVRLDLPPLPIRIG